MNAAVVYGLGVLAPAALGVAAAGDVDLGIPLSAPWQDPALQQPGSRRAGSRPGLRAHPLEEGFWERLAEDATAVERLRRGLLEAAAFAASRPRVFGADAAQPEQLFDEHREEAEAAWTRAMDHDLALDALRWSWRASGELTDSGERDAAFLVAAAAALAQARFAREWTEAAGRSAALQKLFDRPIPALGLPAGGYAALLARLSPEALSRLAGIEAERRRLGVRPLSRALGMGTSAWVKAREQDARRLRPLDRASRPGPRRPRPDRAAAFAADHPAVSRPGELPGELQAPATRQETIAPLFSARARDYQPVSIGSQVVATVNLMRDALWPELPPGARPEALLTWSQVQELGAALEPGDLLLVRRERAVGEAGLPGFWHHAALYLGDSRSRRALAPDLDKRFSGAFPEAFRASVSSRTFPAARWVAEALAGGVALRPLEAAAAADHVAALRPRLAPESRAEAVLRAAAWVGRPYDPASDLATEGRLSAPELLWRAYAGLLRLPVLRQLGRSAASANDLARLFDEEFGLEGQQLRLVRFFSGRPEWHRARPAGVEEFRRSWRAPKWNLEKTPQTRTGGP